MSYMYKLLLLVYKIYIKMAPRGYKLCSHSDHAVPKERDVLCVCEYSHG